MKTRTATINDYDDLCKLYKQIDIWHMHLLPEIFQMYPDPARPRDFLVNLIDDKDADIIVVEHKDEIIGLITLKKTDFPPYPLFRRRPYVMITTFVIEESHRRMGIGSLLLQAAKDWTLNQGARFIQAVVWDANTIASDFYAKQRFKTLNRRIELKIET